MSTYITPHFMWAEFASHDGTGVPEALQPNVRRLCQTLLEPLRSRWGGAIVVISGYRSPAHNAAVGGAQASQHMLGKAADVRCSHLDELPKLQHLIEQMIARDELEALGGFGVYPSWLHVDIRDRAGSHIARWTGEKMGAEVV